MSNKMKKRTITDRSVILILGIGVPSFLILIIFLIIIGVASDILSSREAFEAAQYSATTVIIYTSAILGYAFSNASNIQLNAKENSNQDHNIKAVLRPIISLVIIFGLLLGMLTLTILMLWGILPFNQYKTSSAINTWILTGLSSFIIGKYFWTVGVNISE